MDIIYIRGVYSNFVSLSHIKYYTAPVYNFSAYCTEQVTYIIHATISRIQIPCHLFDGGVRINISAVKGMFAII